MSYRAPRLKGLDLDRSKDSPEILFNELTEASRKMDGIVARIQEYTRGCQVPVTKLEAQLSQLTQEGRSCQRNRRRRSQTLWACLSPRHSGSAHRNEHLSNLTSMRRNQHLPDKAEIAD